MNSMLLLIALASLGLAAATSVVAWRALRNEQRRSQARVAALSAEIDDEGSFPAQAVPGLRDANRMFSVDQEAQARSPLPFALAAGAVIVSTIIVLALVVPGGNSEQGSQGSLGSLGSLGSTGSMGSPGSTGSPVADRVVSAPIELLALGHERSADRLTVRGVVRNPANGLDVPHLTAVVLLFNNAGAVVTTGRAAVEARDLIPGAEAPFTISVPDGSDIGRYRVSFRTGDDRVVPHVDKRDGA
jgi:hypothetical protein